MGGLLWQMVFDNFILTQLASPFFDSTDQKFLSISSN